MQRLVSALVFSVIAVAACADSANADLPSAKKTNQADRARVAQAGIAPIAPNSGNAIEYGAPLDHAMPPTYGPPMDPLQWHTTVPPAHCLDYAFSLGLMKRYFPYPDEDDRAMPRASMLDIHIPPDARLFIDGNEVAAFDGFFRYDSKKQLIPGVAYIHEIRVERLVGGFPVAVREVDVYLRMGRLTELTFY